MQACRDLAEDAMDIFSCFCCTQCKPRYKRLVDSIYPRNLADGPVWSNMQKLTFYAMSHPEKLNRIGIYIVSRLSRDLYRQRVSMVEVKLFSALTWNTGYEGRVKILDEIYNFDFRLPLKLWIKF